MALGILKPVASLNSLPCSGHGLLQSNQPCGSLTIVVGPYCWWAPQPLIPLEAVNPLRATVLVNGLPIMLFGDTFTPHTSTTANIINYLCPIGKAMVLSQHPYLRYLTVEDMVVLVTSICVRQQLTVYALKRPLVEC